MWQVRSYRRAEWEKPTTVFGSKFMSLWGIRKTLYFTSALVIVTILKRKLILSSCVSQHRDELKKKEATTRSGKAYRVNRYVFWYIIAVIFVCNRPISMTLAVDTGPVTEFYSFLRRQDFDTRCNSSFIKRN